ncbi:hypothetical protein [Enterococcus sp. AZ102]|uniref:hypothetical protein n=1 Tax=unclassified Enterococcus TaxID=2608891 RepID=UPI003F1FF67E
MREFICTDIFYIESTPNNHFDFFSKEELNGSKLKIKKNSVFNLIDSNEERANLKLISDNYKLLAKDSYFEINIPVIYLNRYFKEKLGSL